MRIPKPYQWITEEKTPRIFAEAVKLVGVDEIKGVDNNPQIIAWAKEIGGAVAGWYDSDEKPWCGLAMAVCAKRAGLAFPAGFDALRALSWAAWGIATTVPALGDILVFDRAGGGHVGLYVGEDGGTYHVLGGNQSDSMRISRILKARLKCARRTPFSVLQPKAIRPIYLVATGEISKNES